MMEQIPDVSIVIAAFNAAATIERAISGAMEQQGVSFEVIVIDDQSTDDTRDVVAAMADPRIRLIALPRNRGPGGARNAGIDAARGRWIAVLDADDTMRPDRLAKLVKRAEAENAQIVVDNLAVVTADGTSTPMFQEHDLAKIPTLTLPAFIHSNVLFQSQHNFGYLKPVFSRAFLAERGLRFDETLRIGEDYILLASALATGAKCVVSPTVGYIYHITEGSISRVLKVEHVEAMIAADAEFVQRHPLDRASLAAQRRRQLSLKQALSFVTLVSQLKTRAYGGALRTALGNPVALRHLSMPIAARLQRLRRTSSATLSNQSPSQQSQPANGPHISKG